MRTASNNAKGKNAERQSEPLAATHRALETSAANGSYASKILVYLKRNEDPNSTVFFHRVLPEDVAEKFRVHKGLHEAMPEYVTKPLQLVSVEGEYIGYLSERPAGTRLRECLLEGMLPLSILFAIQDLGKRLEQYSGEHPTLTFYDLIVDAKNGQIKLFDPTDGLDDMAHTDVTDPEDLATFCLQVMQKMAGVRLLEAKIKKASDDPLAMNPMEFADYVYKELILVRGGAINLLLHDFETLRGQTTSQMKFWKNVIDMCEPLAHDRTEAQPNSISELLTTRLQWLALDRKAQSLHLSDRFELGKFLSSPLVVDLLSARR